MALGRSTGPLGKERAERVRERWSVRIEPGSRLPGVTLSLLPYPYIGQNHRYNTVMDPQCKDSHAPGNNFATFYFNNGYGAKTHAFTVHNQLKASLDKM